MSVDYVGASIVYPMAARLEKLALLVPGLSQCFCLNFNLDYSEVVMQLKQ